MRFPVNELTWKFHVKTWKPVWHGEREALSGLLLKRLDGVIGVCSMQLSKDEMDRMSLIAWRVNKLNANAEEHLVQHQGKH